jgi:predicted alpha/beta superfamily hydrolase
MAAGSFQTIGPFEPPGFPARTVTLYEPPGKAGIPRPVLYVLDGQNAFGDTGQGAGWHLHDALDALPEDGAQRPLVVAIPHGGATRADELLPWWTDGFGGGSGARFLEWIVNGLMPVISRERAVVPGPVGTAICGASWGGTFAFYAHFVRPDVFGGALCLSPAFWTGRFAMFGELEWRANPMISRIYVDCGAHEAQGRMLQGARSMAEKLWSRGYRDEQFWFRPDPDGHHTEQHWRKRLPEAVRFMYRK